MELLISLLIGLLFGTGIYCLLRRSIMKVIVGIMLLSQGANLLVFSAGSLTSLTPVFASGAEGSPPLGAADPLPQALVLTAIVIGFGIVLFSIALLLRTFQVVGNDDVDALNQTDQI